MPNSQNRNAGDNNNSKGQPKHDPEKAATSKANTERSDLKDKEHHAKDHKGDTSRSSSQGRKSSSGGRVEE